MREDNLEPDLPTMTWREVLFKAPLGDLLRGYWSSRGSYKRALRDCSLPAVITEQIGRIVRKAHLWQSERNDVTRELIAHFQEGLDRGVPAALLVDQFGDVKTTARLIRRAKLRKRPIWWKTWYGVSRTVVAVLALLFFIYIVQSIRLFTSHSVVDRNYLAELNAPIRAIPEKDRAWPRYVDAMHDFPEWPDGYNYERLSTIDPTSPDWPKIVNFVEKNKDRIEALQQIALMPHLGLILGDPNSPTNRLTEAEFNRYRFFQTPPEYLEPSNPSLGSVHLGEYELFLNATDLLSFAALDAAARGNSAEFVKNVKALVGTGDQVFRDRPFVIEQNFGLIAYMRACAAIRFVLAENPSLLSTDQLRDLSHQVKSINKGEPFHFRTDVELLTWLDTIRRSYTSGQNGHISFDGWKYFRSRLLTETWPRRKTLLPESIQSVLEAPLFMTFAINRGEAENRIKHIIRKIDERASGNPWEGDGIALKSELEGFRKAYMSYPSDPIGAFAADWMTLSFFNITPATMMRDATVIALALNLYKRERNKWPTELVDLVPEYLDSIPLDPNDGQPLRYRLTEEGPILYSIGADRHDDGGRPDRAVRTSIFSMNYPMVPRSEAVKIHNDPDDPRNGDWILWPVEKKSE